MAGRAFLAFILFFLIANPLTYQVTRKVFGGIASTDGLPTQVGVLLHAFVFVMLSKFVMRRFSGYKGRPGDRDAGAAHAAAAEAIRQRLAREMAQKDRCMYKYGAEFR